MFVQDVFCPEISDVPAHPELIVLVILFDHNIDSISLVFPIMSKAVVLDEI